LLIQPFLQFLLGKPGTTLKEFVVICGLFFHSLIVFTISLPRTTQKSYPSCRIIIVNTYVTTS
jgi:hypothetical protein